MISTALSDWLRCVVLFPFPRVSAVMGKAEGSVAREEWHGHVTALSVAPEFRRLGLAAKLMDMLEEISERCGSLLGSEGESTGGRNPCSKGVTLILSIPGLY